MFFKDYEETKVVYHIVSLEELEKCLKEGINYNDKCTYNAKYKNFHQYFDMYKNDNIPQWVERKKAVFASLNFDNSHKWHSHTAILKLTIDESMCWICNENIANFLYEPIALMNMEGFYEAKEYIENNVERVVRDYWKNSCSFKENKIHRYDFNEGYDAEVLILHHIPAKNIECCKIISDHKMMNFSEWKEFFRNSL